MPPKDAEGMAKSVDPDQTAEQSDLSLHCLLRPVCLSIKNIFMIPTCAWGPETYLLLGTRYLFALGDPIPICSWRPINNLFL